jgi:membrane-bound lytic murein transglycosylase D
MGSSYWRLAALAILGCSGTVACAGRRPVAVAPTPAPQAAPAAAAAPATPPEATPPAMPSASQRTGAVTAAAGQAAAASAGRTVQAPADTASEDEFLDSLRVLSADSAVRPHGQLPAEVVRSEATALFGPPPAAMSPAATWDMNVANYAQNERVQAYIEYFTGPARRHFEVYLSRLARYETMIRERLRDGGLPQDLVYLALIESGMNPNAVSRSRAVGLWQFIQATGRRYGLDTDPWLDERRDPFLATDAAVRFLRELNNRYGSLYLAAAAYNSGPGKIDRGLNRYDFGALAGDDVFFALAEEPYLRRETKDYVPKLIAAAIIAKQPERYGFTDIVPLAPLVYDSVQVTDAVGLDVLARISDTTQAALEELNPQLVRRLTPPGRTVWVRVPVGRAATVPARLASVPARERITHLVHVIRRGETLRYIAGLYHVGVDDITAANRGVSARRLRVGRELVIPTSGVPSAIRSVAQSESRASSGAARRFNRAASTMAARRSALNSAMAARRTPAASSRRTPVLASVVPLGTTRRTVHIVRSGETLSAIAEQFRVPLTSLLQANRMTRRSRIKPGDAIRIPG